MNDEGNSVDEDSFFELLTRFQSKRMDDQRCTLASEDGEDEGASTPLPQLLENDDGAPTLNGGPPPVVVVPARVPCFVIQGRAWALVHLRRKYA